MPRLALVIVAATALSGCQHSGQQAIDPFWGHTTVPSPATGSIGAPIISPGCPPPLQQPIVTQGTPISNGGPQATTPPNLLPTPASSTPSPPGTAIPTPATPGVGGSVAPYGPGIPAVTGPPPGYSTPDRAPPSGYLNPAWSPAGTAGTPAAGMPGSAPAATYPTSPAPSAAPSGTAPPTGGIAPLGPGPGPYSPPGPATPAAPTPAGSPPAGYFPPDGSFNYHGTRQDPPGRGNRVTPSGVAAVPVSLDGAIVSAPPTAGLDAGPSIVRIPTTVEGGSTVTPASASQ